MKCLVKLVKDYKGNLSPYKYIRIEGGILMDKKVENFYSVDYSYIDFPLITIYKNTTDYPNCYVARLWDTNKPTNVIMVSKDIETIRKNIPVGMYKLGRRENDDKCIVETWI
jgi:hypothetical protein